MIPTNSYRFETEEIAVHKILILLLNFLKIGFPTPSIAFLDENF